MHHKTYWVSGLRLTNALSSALAKKIVQCLQCVKLLMDTFE